MSIAFRAATGYAANSNSFSVTVPGGVQAGDVELLFLSYTTSGTTVTGPAGWTAIGTNTSQTQAVKGWIRIADGSSAGSTVTVGTSGTGKHSLEYAAYSGVDNASPFLVSQAYVPGSTANSWTMPNLSPAAAGWRVDFLGQRSSTPATAWTVPSGMTKRDERLNTGSGASYAVIADSNGDVGPGSVTGLGYSNNGSATAAFAGWTLILAPDDGPPPSGHITKVWSGSAWDVIDDPKWKVWDGTTWVLKDDPAVKTWGGSDWS